MITDIVREQAESTAAKDRAVQIPAVKRAGRPSDVADAVAFLATERAGFISGEVLLVTGGRYG